MSAVVIAHLNLDSHHGVTTRVDYFWQLSKCGARYSGDKGCHWSSKSRIRGCHEVFKRERSPQCAGARGKMASGPVSVPTPRHNPTSGNHFCKDFQTIGEHKMILALAVQVHFVKSPLSPNQQGNRTWHQ